MGEVFSHISPDSKRRMRGMNTDMALTLLLSLVLRLWTVALLWTLLVSWAEARVTQGTPPQAGRSAKLKPTP